jgi:hypothetical protein
MTRMFRRARARSLGSALGAVVLVAAFAAPTAAEAAAVRRTSPSGTVEQPNYQVSAITDPPKHGVPGQAFTVGDTTTNVGGDVGHFTLTSTQYFMSSDKTKDASDPAIAARSMQGLAAGESNSLAFTTHLPSVIAAGKYYVIACADNGDAVDESSETDNCLASAKPVRIKVKAAPDYRVTSVTSPDSTVTAGGFITVNDTVKNAGAGASDTANNAYYFSHDATVDASDFLSTSFRGVPALSQGATNSATFAGLVVPPDITPGRYHVIVCADSGDAIAELDETNNCRALAKRVRVEE